MKKQYLFTFSLMVVAGLFFSTGSVRAQDVPTPTAFPAVTPAGTAALPGTTLANPVVEQTTIEPAVADQPLCKPGVYLIPPLDCLLLGPAKVLTDLANKGLFIPPRPLAARKPDAGLVLLDQKYAKLNLTYPSQATFYPNAQSAEAGINWLSQMPPGQLQYLSYKSATVINKHNYVIMEKGEWVRASPTNYSSFQGLLFDSQPLRGFGWIVDATSPRIAPIYHALTLPEKLTREMVVQIYDKVEVGAITWYMIGLGRWVENRYIRVVDAQASAPTGVDNNRWIEVNLLQQTLTVYDQGKLVFATLIATGVAPYYTQPGLFKITEKKPLETMTGAFETGKLDYYFLQDVPWTMYFDQKRALHGAYWRAMFGFPQSHGCVNISVGDSHWLYDWANVGDWVYVWDPSNKTPTDPALYGSGGA
jgi:hypothetical protein